MASLKSISLFEHLTWLNICKGGALVLSAHMLHFGIWAFRSPAGMCREFGIRYDGKPWYAPETQSPSAAANRIQSMPAGKDRDELNANHWALLFAPRECGFGLLVAGLGAVGEWRAAGIVIAIIAGLLAPVDSFVVGQYGKGGWKEALKIHVPVTVALGAISTGLLWS